jgi:ABC-type multidrug transport system ATPase subunit
LAAIAGRNGSGKTTLLKILAGLLRPDAGSVRIERAGAPLSGEPLRLSVGWAGQDLGFYEDLTAHENLTFFRRAAGEAADRGEIRRRLDEVDLAHAADQRVGGFSTGMKQRLRVAFATLFDPPVLLLDEPMAGLDVAGRELVARLIEVRRRSGAVFLASNDERDFVQPDQVFSLGR